MKIKIKLARKFIQTTWTQKEWWLCLFTLQTKVSHLMVLTARAQIQKLPWICVHLNVEDQADIFLIDLSLVFQNSLLNNSPNKLHANCTSQALLKLFGQKTSSHWSFTSAIKNTLQNLVMWAFCTEMDWSTLVAITSTFYRTWKVQVLVKLCQKIISTRVKSINPIVMDRI